MSLYTKQVTVATTSTALTPDTATGVGRNWRIVNRGANTVYIGAGTVSTTTGFALQKQGDGTSSSDAFVFEIELAPDETLYAVTSTGTSSVHVFAT